MIKKPKKTNIFIKIILLIFVVCAVYIGNVVFFPASLPGESYRLIIDRQVNLRDFATDLENKGIIKSSRIFLFLLRIMHEDRKVTAGLYILSQPMSIWKLIARITNGHPDKLSVTLIDGWVTAQIRAYINSLTDIQHITAKMSDDELKMALKIDEPSLEGLFYPSTYFVAPNQTDLEIYQQAYHTLQDKLTALYAAKSPGAYYSSPYQLLIMASLIHKETARVQDMYLVSTVFNNRLRIGMKLQDDPSVFYGLKGIRDGKVTRADFQIDTPYNTYLRLGLPPTPICTPSDAALKAASQPLNRPDLMYFVAIGGGKTQFSETYNQHMGAVNKYLKKPAEKHVERTQVEKPAKKVVKKK
jgi:UPF0755 protein